MPFLRYTLALLASLAGSAEAATRSWPGAAPCADTLQACVDAADDGDVVEIATDAPIAASLLLANRSLSLIAADGYAPSFSGFGLTITGSAGDIDVRVRGLRFNNGFVAASYSGSGEANFDLRELALTRAPGAAGNGIRVVANGGTVNATLYDNRIMGRPLDDSGLVLLQANGATLNADAYYNQIENSTAEAVDGNGIRVEVRSSAAGAGAGTIKLHGNVVRGGFGDGGIVFSERRGTSGTAPSEFRARAYSNVVVGAAEAPCRIGIEFLADHGRINAQAINNTITLCELGIAAGPHPGSGVDSAIEGLVKNNLIVSNSWAMWFTPETTAGVENDYNLVGADSIYGATPGPHTVTADARLVTAEAPRLRADSPARDAGDTGTLVLGAAFNGLPFTDADGLRRLKLDLADIGAYEFGDASFLHTAKAGTIGGHLTWIDHPAVNGAPDANLLVTPNYNAGLPTGEVGYAQPYGTWYASGSWSVFNENTAAAMPAGVHFDVFAPAAGSGAFRHRTSADSVSGWTSRLDDSSLNDRPDRIVLATQNFSAGGIYNAHPIGVFYLAFGGPGSWHVANIDLADGGAMPVGAGFSIYAQEPSPNAFRFASTAANRLDSRTAFLDHPLLNDTPCAQPHVTRLFDGTPTDRGFDVGYLANSRRWTVFAWGDGGLPLGTEFNVLIDPAQVFECRDRIFADGFD